MYDFICCLTSIYFSSSYKLSFIRENQSFLSMIFNWDQSCDLGLSPYPLVTGTGLDKVYKVQHMSKC